MTNKEEFVPNELLRHARSLKGWSQAELAEQVGTSFEIVSRWERGITIPSLITVSACARSWVRVLRNSGSCTVAEM